MGPGASIFIAMPPRIPVLQCLRAPNAAPSLYYRPFTSSTSSQASTTAQKRRHRDPYAIAQAKARKTANLSRQEVLKKERAAALGDPVKGVETPYLRSLDSGIDPEPTDAPISTKTRIKESPDPSAPGPRTSRSDHLNFFLNKDELDDNVARSVYLSNPQDFGEGSSGQSAHPADFTTEGSTPETRAARLREERETAAEALRRISSLSLASSSDVRRVNTQRIIKTFGRHQTDSELLPRPASAVAPAEHSEKTPRAGPDTGSSEVQIALLTAKIRTLTQFLETRGTMDKTNKRNLRLMVHKRQKLMAYLRKKERGGPRWQNIVETLGLTDAMWKGQIVLDRNMKAIVPGTLKHELYKEEKNKR